MARGSELKEVKENFTLAQKMMSGVMAEMWSRSDNPPLGSDKSGYYAAALASNLSPDARPRMARCLVWSDFLANQYCLGRLEWYGEAARCFPEEERCIFYVAALCQMQVIQEPELIAFVYHRLLNPAWDRSPYWNRFALPQRQILNEVGRLYASMPETITPERVEIVERTLEAAEDRSADKGPLAAYLACAYRQQGRTDETAEIVYRFIFAQYPEDQENNAFLGRLYLQRQKMDADACAVFARMVTQCDNLGNLPEANFWVLRLANAYLSLGRVDEGTLTCYQRATTIAPEDQDLRAALICSLARRRDASSDKAIIEQLEEALEEESLLMPRFTARRWDWSLVLRALAYAYGRADRTDDAAVEIYTRATTLCPEERELWGFYARSLAHRGAFSPEAVEVYEKAARTFQSSDVVAVALARAYVRLNAYEGPRREAALKLWEDMYRQGVHWPEMVQALAKAYTAEDRVNDIALSLWEKSIAEDDKNGPMRLRLAQEYRARSDYELAAKYFKQAAKLMPKDFVAQFETASLLVDQYNDYLTAIRLLQKAIKLPAGEKHLEAHFLLGEALLAREKREEARAVFQKIVDTMDPNHTPTLLHLAKLSLKYEEEGMKQAQALYQQAQTIDPNLAETYRRMADLYHEKGQYAEEEKALEKYLELSEPDAEKYRALADLYIRRGDYTRAEGALRQVIALGQGDKRLYTLLGEVIVLSRQQASSPSG